MNVIEIENLSKKYKVYNRNVADRIMSIFSPNKKRYFEYEVLKCINMKIKKGEILGIIGRNGAGKSSLLKIISKIVQPTGGEVKVNGKVVPLLELGDGFNPEYSGKDNIYFMCSLQGMKKAEIDKKYDEILKFSELKEFIHIPVKKYSSGMKSRLGFAISVNIDPDILILDEVLSVGDELFRRKCFLKMKEFFNKNKTVIFVSHNLRSIQDICSRAIIIDGGNVVYDGNPKDAVNRYRLMLGRTNNNLNKDSLNEKSISDFKKIKRIIKKKNIEIYDYGIYDIDGNEKTVLDNNQEYVIKFKANFKEMVENVRLGVGISSDTDKDLQAIFLPKRNEPLPFVSKNEIIQFQTKFKPILKSGLYGMRFSIRSINEDCENPIFIILDAILFKVINIDDDFEGLVALTSNAEILKINNHIVK